MKKKEWVITRFEDGHHELEEAAYLPDGERVPNIGGPDVLPTKEGIAARFLQLLGVQSAQAQDGPGPTKTVKKADFEAYMAKMGFIHEKIEPPIPTIGLGRPV